MNHVCLLDNQRLFLLEGKTAVLRGEKIFADATPWDIQTGLEITRMRLEGWATVVAICRESKRMAVIIHDQGSIQIWDIESWTLLGRIAGHAAAFSPTEMVVASISHPGGLRTWDIGSMQFGNHSNTSDTVAHPCTSLSASRSGTDVISAYSQSRAVFIWKISEQTCLELNVPDLFYPVVMSPDGLYFLCATCDSGHRYMWSLYETKSQQLLHQWRNHDTSIPLLIAAFSEDSTRVAVSSYESLTGRGSFIEVFDIHSGQELPEINFILQFGGMAFLPDGTSLLVIHEAGYEVFNIQSGTNSGSSKWGSDFEFRTTPRLGGIVPYKAQMLVIEFSIGSWPSSYIVNIKDSSIAVKNVESSPIFQFIETRSGYEPLFLVHDQSGNLYKRGRDFKEFLCWLPPTWRFMGGRLPAFWRGSYLIVGLQGGELGVIDIDALSSGRLD